MCPPTGFPGPSPGPGLGFELTRRSSGPPWSHLCSAGVCDTVGVRLASGDLGAAARAPEWETRRKEHPLGDGP